MQPLHVLHILYLDEDDDVQSYSIPSGLLNGILLTGSGDGVAGESLDGVWLLE